MVKERPTTVTGVRIANPGFAAVKPGTGATEDGVAAKRGCHLNICRNHDTADEWIL
jgi:hypothetical protein